MTTLSMHFSRSLASIVPPLAPIGKRPDPRLGIDRRHHDESNIEHERRQTIRRGEDRGEMVTRYLRKL